jgi:hypothetical protein
VRCHLGVGPQERTAEEHTTRGRCTTLATSGRVILGGMVSRGWSLSTVPCEGEMYLAQTLMMNASRRRSSTSYLPELTVGGLPDRSVLDCSTSQFGSRGAVLGRSEVTCFSSPSDDEVGA